MKIKLDLDHEEYETLIDLLHTCSDYNDIFIVDREFAERVLKQLEEIKY